MNRTEQLMAEAAEKIKKDRTTAGRPMDLAIATELFGMQLLYGPGSKYQEYIVGMESKDRFILKHYSRNMEDAQFVIDELWRRDIEITIQASKGFICASTAMKGDRENGEHTYSKGIAAAVGESIPHAICHVALVTLEELRREVLHKPVREEG